MATIRINRAPVLTLWASVVAERLGWPRATALTMGQAVAGMNAYSKGVRLGIYEPAAERPHELAPPQPPGATGKVREVPLLGRVVHVAPTASGPRAISKGAISNPESVERYLRGKFGEHLDVARAAMEKLASTIDRDAINEQGFHLYEQFRPQVPAGERGWGAKGVLDLRQIAALARSR